MYCFIKLVYLINKALSIFDLIESYSTDIICVANDNAIRN